MSLSRKLTFLLLLMLTSLLFIMVLNQTPQHTIMKLLVRKQYLHSSDFEFFDNETGSWQYIVPNIVHFLRFNQTEFRFMDVICILAAVKNQQPTNIFIHTNNFNFSGKYWNFLLNNKEFAQIYQLKYIDIPEDIFGQKFNPTWHLQHASDVTRIQILMKYGGIYLDNDSYLIQNLNKFRKFEMTLAWDNDKFLGTQTLVAHSKSRFLTEWLESYRDNYNPKSWYYNAGERPTSIILNENPNFVHRIPKLFGADIRLSEKIYKNYWKNWKDYYVVHLLINHRWYLDKENFLNLIHEFDEVNVLNYNFTIGEMIRDVLEWNEKCLAR